VYIDIYLLARETPLLCRERLSAGESLKSTMCDSDSDDQMQMVDEVTMGKCFQEFFEIFFDPCHRRQRFVFGRNCVPAHCRNPFVEGANRLHLQQTAVDIVDESKFVTAAGASSSDGDETGISEGSEARSAEDSELSPTGPDAVSEMDQAVLNRQWTGSGCSHRASLSPHLRRTSSYEALTTRTQMQMRQHLSDSAALRRASSSYGSQDQSLPTTDQYEELGPPRTGVRTRNNSDVSTLMFTADDIGPPQPSNVSFPPAEVPYNFVAANIPFAVTGWQLTDDDRFEPVHMSSAADHFVSATNGSEQDRFPSVGQWQELQQTLNFQQLYEDICQLETRVIQRLLVELLHENNSPEFVQSVAEILFLSIADAEAVGKSP